MKSVTRSFGMITNYDSETKLQAKDMFKSYSVEQQGLPLVLLSMNELDKYNCFSSVLGGIMVKYKDNLSEEDYENALNSTYALGSSVEFSEIRENSLKEIKDQMTVLAPIIGGIILLVIVSVLSLSAVNTNKQLRNYAVYYICGSIWKQCAVINAVSIIISVLAGGLLSYICLKLAQNLKLLKDTVVTLGEWQILGCVAIVIITLIASLIMPLLIIGKSTPREILKSK